MTDTLAEGRVLPTTRADPGRRPRWPPRPGLRLSALLVAGAVFVAAAAWFELRPGRLTLPTLSTPVDPPADSVTTMARSFLDRYEAADGRIVRTDQGGDTVSEGQAYGLLLAVVAGDRGRFDLAWHWTAGHLRRPDGLLAWHWDHGAVVDPMPAADGDLDAAWALGLAWYRFGRPADRDAAVGLSRAILQGETSGGLLVAGPWATRPPVTVSPGYDSPEAFDLLGRLTGDPRWAEMATAAQQAIDRLTAGGTKLPPEWAVQDGSGTLRPSPAPDRSAPAQYGLGAARAAVWLAASCDPADRQLAAHLGRELRTAPSAATRRLDGAPLGASGHPASLAAAGLGIALSDPSAGSARLGEAGALIRSHPSYYGDAVVALAATLLDRPAALGGCPVHL